MGWYTTIFANQQPGASDDPEGDDASADNSFSPSAWGFSGTGFMLRLTDPVTGLLMADIRPVSPGTYTTITAAPKNRNRSLPLGSH